MSRVKAVLAGLLVLSVWVWLYRDLSERQAADAARAEAVQAARDAIPAILSYGPDTAANQLPAAANDRLTGKFLEEFTQLITTVVIPEARQKNLSASATVPAVGAVSADGGHAVVLAYVDQSMKAGAAAPTQTSSTVRVTMDKVGGRWLISAFEPI